MLHQGSVVESPSKTTETRALDDSMAVIPTSIPDGVVTESCLDFLLIEMVNAMLLGLDTESDSDKDVAYYKLNNIGFRVGCGLAERYGPNSYNFS